MKPTAERLAQVYYEAANVTGISWDSETRNQKWRTDKIRRGIAAVLAELGRMGVFDE